MGRLHDLKVMKRDNPGAYKGVVAGLSHRINTSYGAKYTKKGEIQATNARKKKKRR